MVWPVAALDVTQPLVERDDLTGRAHRHVGVRQRVQQVKRRPGKLPDKILTKTPFGSLELGTRVVGDELGDPSRRQVPDVPSPIQLMTPRHHEITGIADVMQPRSRDQVLRVLVRQPEGCCNVLGASCHSLHMKPAVTGHRQQPLRDLLRRCRLHASDATRKILRSTRPWRTRSCGPHVSDD